MKKKINVFKLVQSLPNDVHIVYPVNGYLSIKKKKKKKKRDLNGNIIKRKACLVARVFFLPKGTVSIILFFFFSFFTHFKTRFIVYNYYHCCLEGL